MNSLKFLTCFLVGGLLSSSVKAEVSEGSYYIDSGGGHVVEIHESPDRIQPTEWQIRLYRRGAPASGPRHWGLITGRTAAEVIHRYRVSYKFEQISNRFLGIRPETIVLTFDNPLGPIAKMANSPRALTGHIQRFNSQADAFFEQAEDVVELFENGMDALDLNSPSVRTLLSGASGYLQNLREAFENMERLRSQIENYTSGSMSEIESGFREMGRELTQLRREQGRGIRALQQMRQHLRQQQGDRSSFRHRVRYAHPTGDSTFDFSTDVNFSGGQLRIEHAHTPIGSSAPEFRAILNIRPSSLDLPRARILGILLGTPAAHYEVMVPLLNRQFTHQIIYGNPSFMFDDDDHETLSIGVASQAEAQRFLRALEGSSAIVAAPPVDLRAARQERDAIWSAYSDVLGRAPTEAQLAQARSQFTSPSAFRAQLAASTEFQQSVQEIYQDSVGRAPTRAEIDEAVSDTRTRGSVRQIVSEVSSSSEATQHAIDVYQSAGIELTRGQLERITSRIPFGISPRESFEQYVQGEEGRAFIERIYEERIGHAPTESELARAREDMRSGRTVQIPEARPQLRSSPRTREIPRIPSGRITIGDGFGCAIQESGFVRCWGHARPLGAIQIPPTLRPVAISAGHDVLCALLNDQSVQCFGNSVTGSYHVAGRTIRLQLNPSSGMRALSVEASPYGSGICSVTTDHQIVCWGSHPESIQYQVPANERAIALSTYSTVNSCALREDHSVFCFGEEGSTSVYQPPAGLRAIQTSAGIGACAVTEDHRVVCWGDNADGSVTASRAVPRGLSAISISQYGSDVCAIRDDQSVVCWSTMPGVSAPLPVPSGLRAQELVVRAGAACVVDMSGTVQCFGRRSFRGPLPQVGVPAGTRVRAVR